MSFDYRKPKSAAKQVTVKGPDLERIVLDTMRTISSVVGATLGPGGQPVLIERFDHGVAPTITKDGVTVFRALGFQDPTAQCVMEAARDAAVRTASEAGDGTTTATILAEAIVRLMHAYCKANPRTSPQQVVRRLMEVFRLHVEPLLKGLATKAQLGTDEGDVLLKSVARISANGDAELADAVMECFDIAGDEGNVTITELNGPSRYEVEHVEGYPVPIGYEESCMKFYPSFVNDPANQRTVMDKPVFVCYHGKITEMQSIVMLMERIGQAWQENGYNHNVVLVATGFSETVLATLAMNFAMPNTINVFPLLVPHFPTRNGQLDFLEDLCAVAGAELFDPLNSPLDGAQLWQLGPGVQSFEAARFRSTILGRAFGTHLVRGTESYEDHLLLRVDNLKVQAENPESDLDKVLIQERIAKLTGGIARLKVIGSSSGELREKKDRAEDAICAVRGAIKHGCVPGGGWAFLKVMSNLRSLADPVVDQVLLPALFEPVERLLLNAGIGDDTALAILTPVLEALEAGQLLVYDVLAGKHVEPFAGGILDSLPAVLEAIRNSLSIALVLGTLGGCVVYRRDEVLEREEARATQQFLRDANEAAE